MVIVVTPTPRWRLVTNGTGFGVPGWLALAPGVDAGALR